MRQHSNTTYEDAKGQGKLNVIKPNLTKNTIYRKSFSQQKQIPNIVNHHKEYDRLKGPHLDINTVYRTGFSGNNGDKI